MSLCKSIVCIVCLATSVPALASEELFERAEVAARGGEITMMQEAYESILRSDPTNVRALNGQATALAWAGHYPASQSIYLNALRIEPDNPDALTGIGYAYAWSGDYARAHLFFRRALTVAPDNVNAQKGDAYTYLWSGETVQALQSFEVLAAGDQGDAEVAVALGQAHLQQGEARRAVAAFGRALSIDPQRTDAAAGRTAAYNVLPLAETGLWFGSTSNASSGLRLAEIVYRAGPKTRLSARYDDSLSLDNPALSRSGDSAETYLAGIQHRFDETWSGSLELGRRILPDGDQDLYHAEIVWNGFPGRVTLGSQFGNHERGYSDRLAYIGYNFPLRDRWRMESTTYLSTTGASQDDEWRTVLNVEYRAESGWNALVGGGYGQISSSSIADSQDVRVAHAIFSMPIMGYHRLHLTVRHETTPETSFNVVMLGITLRLPRG